MQKVMEQSEILELIKAFDNYLGINEFAYYDYIEQYRRLYCGELSDDEFYDNGYMESAEEHVSEILADIFYKSEKRIIYLCLFRYLLKLIGEGFLNFGKKTFAEMCSTENRINAIKSFWNNNLKSILKRYGWHMIAFEPHLVYILTENKAKDFERYGLKDEANDLLSKNRDISPLIQECFKKVYGNEFFPELIEAYKGMLKLCPDGIDYIDTAYFLHNERVSKALVDTVDPTLIAFVDAFVQNQNAFSLYDEMFGMLNMTKGNYGNKKIFAEYIYSVQSNYNACASNYGLLQFNFFSLLFLPLIENRLKQLGY